MAVGLSAAVVLLGISTLISVVSFSTTSWLTGPITTGYSTGQLSLGLWSTCVDNDCQPTLHANIPIVRILSKWILVVQVCSALGFGIALSAVLLFLCYICADNVRVLAVTAFQLFFGHLVYGTAAMILLIEGLDKEVIYSVAPSIHLGYSFVLAIIGTLLGMMSASLFIAEHRNQNVIRVEYLPLNT